MGEVRDRPRREIALLRCLLRSAQHEKTDLATDLSLLWSHAQCSLAFYCLRLCSPLELD